MNFLFQEEHDFYKRSRNLPLSIRLQRYIPVPESGCWLWTGNINVDGYGQISVNGKSKGVHRAMWEFINGPVPNGLLVCHKCDIPCCVNPSHLFVGTYQDNVRDMNRKGRAPPRFAEHHGHCHISRATVTYIRTSMLTTTELSKELGINRQHVGNIRSFKARRQG